MREKDAPTSVGSVTTTVVSGPAAETFPDHPRNSKPVEPRAVNWTDVPTGPYRVRVDPAGTDPSMPPYASSTLPPNSARIVRPGYRLTASRNGAFTRIVGLRSGPVYDPDPSPTHAPTPQPSGASTWRTTDPPGSNQPPAPGPRPPPPPPPPPH